MRDVKGKREEIKENEKKQEQSAEEEREREEEGRQRMPRGIKGEGGDDNGYGVLKKGGRRKKKMR